MKRIEGILTPIPTPLDKDGRLLTDSVKKLVARQLDDGIRGMYVCGGTGEGTALSVAVRKQMAECVVKAVDGRVPVIIHTGAASLNDAVELSQHAEKIGADYISSVPPFGVAYTEEEVYDYYKTLTDATSLGCIVYYAGSAVRISNETFLKLFELPNVVGIKWTNRDYCDLMFLKSKVKKDVFFINGPDETLICGLAAGCCAGIGSNYNILPDRFIQLYAQFRQGDMAAALKTQQEINAIIEVIWQFGVIRTVKEVITASGIDMGEQIAPMKRYSDAERAEMLARVKAAGLTYSSAE